MDSTFRKNLIWNINQIAVQFVQAQKVKGRAKSGFYKAAIIIASSVVEALAFMFLDAKAKTGMEMPLEDLICKETNMLAEKYQSIDGARLSLCKRVQERFQLKKHTDFRKVNDICLKLNLFSKRFFHKIEKVRELRNKIHIQGLSNIDRSYTKKELEFISSVLADLIKLI